MYSVNIILRDSSLPINVGREDRERALSLLQEIKRVLLIDEPYVLETTDDEKEGRIVIIYNRAILAVTLLDLDKKGSGKKGKPPGFMADYFLEEPTLELELGLKEND